VVDGAGEHPSELRGAEALLEVVEPGRDLADDGVVLLGDAEVEELLRVLDVARELLGQLDLLLDRGSLARDGLRLLGIVPEPRREGGLVETFNLPLQLRDVKDAPLAS
jgi:hypothetical protein